MKPPRSSISGLCDQVMAGQEQYSPLCYYAVWATSKAIIRIVAAVKVTQLYRPATFCRLYVPLVLFFFAALMLLNLLDHSGAQPFEHDDVSSPAFNYFTTKPNQTAVLNYTPAMTSLPRGRVFDHFRTSKDNTRTPRTSTSRRSLVTFADALPILGTLYRGAKRILSSDLSSNYHHFPDGSTWWGPLNMRGLPHGQGRWTTLPDRKGLYVGEARDGKFHGLGTLNRTDGSSYSGEWRNGIQHGKGVGRDGKGANYDGDWKDGERSGKGYLTKWCPANSWLWGSTKKSVYYGEVRNGVPHGHGALTDCSGKMYSGPWVDGRPYTWSEFRATSVWSHLATTQLVLSWVFFSVICATLLFWESIDQVWGKSYDGGGTCVICADSFINPLRLQPCGHWFCKGCIDPWIAHQRRLASNALCPICRKQISGSAGAHNDRTFPVLRWGIAFLLFLFGLWCVLDLDPSALLLGWVLKLMYKTINVSSYTRSGEFAAACTRCSLWSWWSFLLHVVAVYPAWIRVGTAALIGGIQQQDHDLRWMSLLLESVPWVRLVLRNSNDELPRSVAMGGVVLSCIEFTTFVLTLLD